MTSRKSKEYLKCHYAGPQKWRTRARRYGPGKEDKTDSSEPEPPHLTFLVRHYGGSLGRDHSLSIRSESNWSPCGEREENQGNLICEGE